MMIKMLRVKGYGVRPRSRYIVLAVAGPCRR
jgi:hypothetical protein